MPTTIRPKWPAGERSPNTSVVSPPSDEAIQYDIRMTKAFGLNGVRKHQKAEDPRFLYWADKMGLVVWGEMANAYAYSPDYVSRFSAEWV